MDSNTSSNKTTSTARKYTMEKLDDTNYRMRKLRMSLILKRVKLINIVKVIIPQPITIQELIEWKKKD